MRATKSPRQELEEALTRAIAEATRSGDLRLARVAYDALGQLLRAPDGDDAGVADLEAARAGRQLR